VRIRSRHLALFHVGHSPLVSGPWVLIPAFRRRSTIASDRARWSRRDNRLLCLTSAPMGGLGFIGNKLWVTDIAGDLIARGRELPEGLLVLIEINSSPRHFSSRQGPHNLLSGDA
jgi:hypothetical protein